MKKLFLKRKRRVFIESRVCIRRLESISSTFQLSVILEAPVLACYSTLVPRTAGRKRYGLVKFPFPWVVENKFLVIETEGEAHQGLD